MKKSPIIQDSSSNLLKSWFGSNYSFSSNFQYHFSSNTFERALNSENYLKIHENLLTKQKNLTSSQLSLCHLLSSKVDLVNDQVLKFNSFLHQKDLDHYEMTRAATFIQKFIRGFLTRKHIEEFIISRKQQQIFAEIDSVLAQRQFFLYHVGRLPTTSALMIQRAYRRHKFREKIDRLWTAYHNHLLNKEEANFLRLKRRIREIACRVILKRVRFNVRKEKRLKEIREKQALAVIREGLKKMKIRPKMLLERIKKFKRMQRAVLKKKKRKLQEMILNFKGNLEDIKDDPRFELDNISVDSQEELGTTTSDREAMEREKMLRRMEEERKVRISLGKISYNCRDVKVKKMNTLLENLIVPEIESVRELPALTRSPKKIKPRPTPKSRLNLEDPSYLHNTLCFDNRLKKIKDKKKIPKFTKVPLNLGSLLTPTKSSLLKVKFRSMSTGKPEEETRTHSKRFSQGLIDDRNEVRIKKTQVKLSPL